MIDTKLIKLVSQLATEVYTISGKEQLFVVECLEQRAGWYRHKEGALSAMLEAVAEIMADNNEIQLILGNEPKV